MGGVVDLRAGDAAAPREGSQAHDPAHRPGVRRLLELPADQVSDCSLRIRASARGRCAVCRAWYAAEDWIGYSRDAGGWVASCCTAPGGA
jgi:hypothetical protein